MKHKTILIRFENESNEFIENVKNKLKELGVEFCYSERVNEHWRNK